LNEYIEHHHLERNHRGKGNLLLFPSFLHQTQHQFPRAGPFGVATDLAAYLSSIPMPLDSLTTRANLAKLRAPNFDTLPQNQPEKQALILTQCLLLS
jgi:hypothetical protein